MKKFGSRKFIAASLNAGVLILLPFCYKAFGMDMELLNVVLPSVTALTGAYIGFNVLDAVKNGSGNKN